MKEIKIKGKILTEKKQALHKIGETKLVTIPKKYAPDKKTVDVAITRTKKGNYVMIVKL